MELVNKMVSKLLYIQKWMLTRGSFISGILMVTIFIVFFIGFIVGIYVPIEPSYTKEPIIFKDKSIIQVYFIDIKLPVVIIILNDNSTIIKK